ncbi:hypothetical protein PUR71_11840 [Streptomyces sp. SP17BM10]|uniref:hypothetical protein n=1 Tax=Streptomyces sp. SP17BM10 TaxID=3002530 RepID=UPI002E79225D|nr:hypothetical protein [Streptomyces sp. SP17BM10]MEE1783593.1 hypothetical protein [Streptomyces sp. SP17BM10]
MPRPFGGGCTWIWTVRRLAAIALVDTAGNGLAPAVPVLFFTRVTGLSAARPGVGLTLAGPPAAWRPGGRPGAPW